MENVDVNAVDGGPVGGMVGENRGAITNCYSTGNVRGEDCVGGLVGVNDNGTITNCYSISDIAGKGFVGGLTGSSNWTVTNCYSMGMVLGTGESIGGLVGLNYFRITNCYSTARVSGGIQVGGLVGWNRSTISACYSTGSVTGNDVVGGLVGALYLEGEVRDSFWDIETSGQSGSAGGTGKTTAGMKTMSTFTNASWDFVEIWGIGENQTYPFLLTEPAGDLNYDKKVNLADLAILASHWLEGATP